MSVRCELVFCAKSNLLLCQVGTHFHSLSYWITSFVFLYSRVHPIKHSILVSLSLFCICFFSSQNLRSGQFIYFPHFCFSFFHNFSIKELINLPFSILARGSRRNLLPPSLCKYNIVLFCPLVRGAPIDIGAQK